MKKSKAVRGIVILLMSLLVAEPNVILAAEPVMTVEQTQEVKKRKTDILRQELLETIQGESGTLSPSGRALDAAMPRQRTAAGVYTDCFGSQLSGNAKTIYEAEKKRFLEKESLANFSVTLPKPLSFTIYKIQKTDGSYAWDLSGNDGYQNEVRQTLLGYAQTAYDAFLYDYPDVFWLGSMSYDWDVDVKGTAGKSYGTGTVSKITLKPAERYPGAYQEKERYKAKVNAVMQELGSSLLPSAPRSDKVRAIHDYLCRNLRYEVAPWAWSAGGVFLHGTVVCEGYAKAFKVLCDRVGIECALISGKAMGADGMLGLHMWNYVKMENGCWYLVDVTWDDQESSIFYDYFLRGSQGYGFWGINGGVKIGEERILFRNFSSSPYAQTFALPELASNDYLFGSAEHTHSWVEQNRIEPTCEKDGAVRYVCSICKTTKLETLVQLGHSYRYVYNKDATVFEDGTKTGTCRHCGKKVSLLAVGTLLKPNMTLNVKTLRMQKGQSTTKVTVSKLAKGDSVKSWKSSKPSVVKVTKNGKTWKLTAKKAGTAKITVRLKSDYSKSFTVTVQTGKVKTAKLTVTPQTVRVKKGKKCQLAAVVTPVTSQENVTYTSSNKKVASVSAKGVVKGIKKGNAKITVKSGSKKVTVKIVVK